MVFPGIRGDDPAFRRLSSTLADRLEREAPRSRVENGLYTLPASPGGWDKLLCVPGFGMNPAGSPTGQQTDEVTQKWETKRHEALFAKLVRTLFPYGTPADFTSKRDSSTMFPYYSKDPMVKLKSLMSGLSVLRNHLERAVASNTPEALLQDHSFAITQEKASRLQAESGEKVREVFDWMGKRVQASKTLDLPGVDVEAFRMRARTAFGTGFSANAPLVVIAACTRRVPYALFPKSYHHGSADMIQASLSSAYPYATPMDVKNFDQNQGRNFIDTFIANFPVDDRVKLLMRLVSRAPVGIMSDYVGERGFRWVGNPLDFRTYDNHHGNPSGWAINDLLNMAVGSFIVLLVAEMAGAIDLDAPGELEAVLEWKHPNFAMQNKGDDTVLWFAREEHWKRANSLLAAGKDMYLRVELEDGARFLGNVYVKDGQSVKIVPDISSYLVRIMVPEYGWGSDKRPYAAFGYDQRKKYYAAHPLFENVTRAVNDEFSKVYGISLDDHVLRDVRRPEAVELLNYAEMEFVTNPSSIHYKIDVSDIRPQLQEQFFVHVPWSQIKPLVQDLFTTFMEDTNASSLSHL